MNRMLQAFLSVSVLFSCGIYAQDVNQQPPSMEELLNDDTLTREKYDGSAAMPDGTAFFILLNSISTNERDSAIKNIRYRLDTDAATATDLYEKFLIAQAQFERAVNSASLEVACMNGVPRAYGSEAYALLDRLDDVYQEQGDLYLAMFLSGVGTDTADLVSRWIDKKKTTMSYVEIDHEKMLSQTGQSADAALASTCNSLVVIERRLLEDSQ